MKSSHQARLFAKAPLYGILDTGYVEESKLEQVANALLKGGVGVLQFRAKGYSEQDVLSLLQKTAPEVVPMCRSFDVPLIINDFPEVAKELGADGVHIGQDDGSLADVRAIVGDEMIVGRSTHSPDQAVEAMKEGFDYIGFGPLFPTPTKKGRPGIGLSQIEYVQREVGEHLPVYCIGGIKPDNLQEVLNHAAKRVVIVSSLLQAPDITRATREVIDVISQADGTSD